MLRKWMTLAGMMTAMALLTAGLSAASPDEGELEKLMEKVGAKNNAIQKAIRTAVAYKKDQSKIPVYCDELIELAKQAKANKESSEKQKKPYAEWTKLCDDFVKKTEDFKGVVAKNTTTQEQAKKEFNSVKASCTACHNVFKVEE